MRCLQGLIHPPVAGYTQRIWPGHQHLVHGHVPSMQLFAILQCWSTRRGDPHVSERRVTPEELLYFPSEYLNRPTRSPPFPHPRVPARRPCTPTTPPPAAVAPPCSARAPATPSPSERARHLRRLEGQVGRLGGRRRWCSCGSPRSSSSSRSSCSSSTRSAPRPRIRICAWEPAGSFSGRSPAKLRRPFLRIYMLFQSDFQWFRGSDRVANPNVWFWVFNLAGGEAIRIGLGCDVRF